MNILLSIIIPIYKTEEYLEECVNSILYYNTQEIEIILVDDGSPDKCPQLCEELALKDSRIKVVHKENGGLSSARNAGMQVATGKYVTFVDSDDIVFSSSIQTVVEWTKQALADICFLKAVKWYQDGTKIDLGENIDRFQLKLQSREHAINHLTSRAKFPGSAWGKLFRREFLIANRLHFPYDRRYSEDLGFVRDCILCAHTFDALDVLFYQYRQNRPGSITSNFTNKNFYDLLLFITESVEKLTIDKKTNDTICAFVMGFVSYEYSVLLYVYSCLPKADRKKAALQLRKYRWVLKYARNRKSYIVLFVCRLLGPKITAFMMKQYRKVVKNEHFNCFV